jgi:dihydrofolate reductase
MTQLPITLLVAASLNNVIGRDQQLPWRISSDLKRFRRDSMGHGLIMGRNTFESIGRVLPGRTSIVLSRSPKLQIPDVKVVQSLQEATACLEPHQIPFVIGGSQIFSLAFPHAQRLWITRILATVSGDCYLPAWNPDEWTKVYEESHVASELDEFPTRYERWERIAGESSR